MTFKKPSKKFVKKAIFIALILAAGGWFVVRPMLFPPAPVIPTVAASAVEPQDVVSTLSTSGTILSGETRSYFAPMSARITGVGVEAGSTVEAGQLMVAFDQTEIARELKRAQLNYDLSYYEYQQTMEDYEEVDEEVSSLNTKVSRARDDLEDAEEEADSARNSLSEARRRLLAAQSALSDATTQINNKEAEIKDLEEQLAALEEGGSGETTPGGGDQSGGDGSQTGTPPAGGNIGESQPDNPDPGEGDGSDQPTKEELEKRLEEARKELADLKALYNLETLQQAVSQAQMAMEDAAADNTTAAAAEDAARADLDSARRERTQQENNQMGEIEEARLNTTLDLSKLTLEELADQYAQAQGGIVADFDGVITSLSAVEGATASEGMELVTVASREDVKVAVTLSRYDLEQVKLGQEAEISFAGHTYEGIVSKIDETVLDTTVTNQNGTTTTQPTLSAEITILNPDENIKLGLQADVTITTADKSQVLAVPVEAVITDPQGTFVWVVENGLAAKRYVTTGASSDLMTEIASGLQEGDLVIPNPEMDLAEGSPVQIAGAVPAADPSQMGPTGGESLSGDETTAGASQEASLPEEEGASPEGAPAGDAASSQEAQPEEESSSAAQ